MSKAINAGKYRHKVTLVRPATDDQRSDYGERVGEGTPVDTVWAAKEDWAAREGDEFGREYGETTTRFKIRFRTDVDSTLALVHGALTYEILGILDFDGRQRELTLFCKRA